LFESSLLNYNHSAITVIIKSPSWEAAFIFLRKCDRLSAILNNIDLEQMELSFLYLCGAIIEAEIISVLANLNSRESCLEIIEAHPKYSVISFLNFILLSECFRPQLGIIAPVTIPLGMSPWIPHFDDLAHLPLATHDFSCADQSIRMLIY
jgi:hypothetical protein